MRGKKAKELYYKKKSYMDELNVRVRYGDSFSDASEEWLSKYKNISENDEFLKACLAEKDGKIELYIQDLYGAITKNKIGAGHSDAYYSTRGFGSGQHHETFANLTCIYTHENPIFWKHVKSEFPELAKYFEDLIDEVVDGTYFGH